MCVFGQVYETRISNRLRIRAKAGRKALTLLVASRSSSGSFYDCRASKWTERRRKGEEEKAEEYWPLFCCIVVVVVVVQEVVVVIVQRIQAKVYSTSLYGSTTAVV